MCEQLEDGLNCSLITSHYCQFCQQEKKKNEPV